MLRLGMFVYPWDAGASADAFLTDYLSLGCNMLAVNSAYHQCSVLAPRSCRTYGRAAAGASFAAHAEKYGRIRPLVVDDWTGELLSLREQCAKRDVDWRSWVVVLHNDQIGEAYPDTAVRNLRGDCYPSALCVNHPDIREYARALLTDTVETFAPSRVVVESESWMQAFHGRHHEFALARLTPAVRYLLSLCFCPHCLAAAAKAGVDAEEARRVANEVLAKLLEADTTFGANEDAQLTQIFLEYPTLYAYQQFRMNSVASLVADSAAAVRSLGAKYDCIPSAAPFEISATCFEGAPLRLLADTADGFVPLCYTRGESYTLLRRNIRLYAPQSRVALALKLSREFYPDEAAFAALIRDAAQGGAEDIYCYNYGLATAECLGWMRNAYAALRTGKE